MQNTIGEDDIDTEAYEMKLLTNANNNANDGRWQMQTGGNRTSGWLRWPISFKSFWYVTSGRIYCRFSDFFVRKHFKKNIKDIELKFSAIEDWSYLRLWCEFHRSRSKDIEAHLDSKNGTPRVVGFLKTFYIITFFILNIL